MHASLQDWLMQTCNCHLQTVDGFEKAETDGIEVHEEMSAPLVQTADHAAKTDAKAEMLRWRDISGFSVR
jgi:hypothetical protein